MEITETKLWIIQKLIETNDLDQLQKIADILSLSAKTKDHKYIGGDTALKIVKEPDVVEDYADTTTDNYPLSEEQEERLIRELKEAEEDIKAGRVYTMKK